MKESSGKQVGHVMMNFPFDITEAILSSIDSCAALSSLALTCTFWANHIIPRQIQYRTLWLGPPDERTIGVWAHLAIRKDLAKNIRDVWLMSTQPERWRYPTSLVTAPSDDFPSEREVILKALENMELLQRFSWQLSDLGESPLGNRDLASVLRKSRTLARLSITSTDDPRIDVSTISGPEVENHPLFQIADLESLQLVGRFWTFWKRDSLLSSMLSRSPNLQVLELSFGYDSPSFASCFFPCLRKLSLRGDSRGLDGAAVFKFIETHATIEELVYHPIRPDAKLSPGSLPALKKVNSGHELTMGILRDTTVCRTAMEGIGRISLGPNTMQNLEKVAGSALRALYIWRYDNIKMVHQVAKFFPNIMVLEMLQFGVPKGEMDESIDDYIYTLSCFSRLEVLLNTVIWGNIQVIPDGVLREAAISKLAQACPNLKRIQYHNPRNSTRGLIKLKRNGESLTWTECNSMGYTVNQGD